MSLRRLLLVCLVAPALLGARAVTAPEVEALVRAGNAAFERGDYSGAAVYYEKATDRATDPGLVAFNLATAKYHLREGDSQALADAEQAYRCCLAPGDPRRARALFGLGNCLLARAAGASLDPTALRSAIDSFGECLRDPSSDKALARRARYNRQRARLLLLQAPPPPGSSSDDGADREDKPEEDSEQPKQPEDRGADGQERSENRGKGSPARVGEHSPGDDKEGAAGPGRGSLLPPLPDRAEAAPLAPNDALQHLEQATQRILDDARQHRRARSRPAGSGVRDW
jgi:hypothetical protein